MKDSIIKNKRRFLNRVGIFAFWMAVWQITYLIIKQDIYFPAPLDVLMRLREMVFLPAFWVILGYSIYRVMLGLILSIVAGIIVGVVSNMNEQIHSLIKPIITTIRSTPVMSFIIIALIWFSSSNVPIFICFLMCFPIIWTNVVEGIRSVDNRLLEMSRVYRVKRLHVLKRVYLPTIKPYFFAACLTSFGLGWKVTVAAEVLSHPRNAIGSQLYSAKVYLDSSELFAWTLVVIMLSIIFEGIFSRYMWRKNPR